MSTREKRLAENEAIFREVNERVADVSEKLRLDTISAICECSTAGCVERFELGRRGYAEVRQGSPAFGIASVEDGVAAGEAPRPDPGRARPRGQ